MPAFRVEGQRLKMSKSFGLNCKDQRSEIKDECLKHKPQHIATANENMEKNGTFLAQKFACFYIVHFRKSASSQKPKKHHSCKVNQNHRREGDKYMDKDDAIPALKFTCLHIIHSRESTSSWIQETSVIRVVK
jgi:hypothetical protein